jgi:DNA-binding winged helix-turn-helix (wHTH) protein
MPSPNWSYHFGPFTFDPRSLVLTRNGREVPLQPQPAKLLAYLLDTAGTVRTRQELQDSVWGSTFIDRDLNLNYAIRHIRQALGDSAQSPVYLETLPRRGYRFIAPVERRHEIDSPHHAQLDMDATHHSTSATIAPPQPLGMLNRLLRPIATLAALLLLIFNPTFAPTTQAPTLATPMNPAPYSEKPTPSSPPPSTPCSVATALTISPVSPAPLTKLSRP